MKTDSIIKLSASDEIEGFVFNLWKTDLFRESHRTGGFVADIVRPFTTLPCFFFEASDDAEKAHFSTWWRGMQMREYNNDHVHDLYWLHEIYHGGDMVYARGLSHDMFKRKMQDNELGASVCSEIEAYFRLPGLREKTFPQEIYADRFLKSAEMHQRWAVDPDRVVKELRMYRQNIMMSEMPRSHADRSEFWIKQFVYQNESWASIWVHQYNTVEEAMVRMRKTVMAGSKAQALDDHVDFLMSADISQNGTVPFPDEANAFAGNYWLNKKAYERDNAQQATQPQIQAAPAPAGM